MHELPKDLSHSLHSWRGSTYNYANQHDTKDLEKGPDEWQEQLSAKSPLILHPTASSRRLNDTHQSGHQHENPEKHSRPEAEKTTHSPTTQQNPAPASLSIFQHAPKVADPDPATDRLVENETPLSKESFYELIGMHPPQTSGQAPRDLATRHGLYGKIHKRCTYIQTKYRVFDVMTYIFMALQLLLSAVFIVLGSLTSIDSHVAIAVLGAVSTVIAGALALMKGQGLPNRLRQVRDDLSNVLFEAEELYWDVAANRAVLFEDIVKVREDYLRVLQEARRNHPDTWRGSTDIEKGIGRSKIKSTLVEKGK